MLLRRLLLLLVTLMAIWGVGRSPARAQSNGVTAGVGQCQSGQVVIGTNQNAPPTCLASTAIPFGAYCGIDVTLVSGTGSFSSSCITPTSYCQCRDRTNNNLACYTTEPVVGMVGVVGTGSDVVQTMCSNTTTVAVPTTPACIGSLVLASGTGLGTFLASCVFPNSYCSCRDTTDNSAACYTGNPGSGSVAIFGNDGDLAQVSCTQTSAVSGMANYTGAVSIQGTSANGSDVVSGVSVNGVLNAKAYGARGDALYSGDYVRTNDGVTNGSTTFTSASGGFTSALVGDAVFIAGAGTSGGMYVGTVAGFTNATTLTLSSIPPTSGTSLYYAIGYDNTVSLQNWANAVRGGLATNAYGVRGGRQGYLPTGIYLHRGLNFGGQQGMTIDGAGSNVASDGRYSGGSMLLCIVPTTGGGTGMANGCHDFTGAGGGLTLSRIAFVDGVIGMTGSAGTWNFMLARHPTAGFSIINRIADTTFHSAGAWDVVIMNSEQNTWVDDGFNGFADPAHALYLGVSNTPGFVSPFYGSLAGAGVSATINHFFGGKTVFSADGNDAVVLDGQIGDFSINDAYIRLNNSTDNFMVDSSTGTICVTCAFNSDRVEAYGTPTSSSAFIKWTNASSNWQGGSIRDLSWSVSGGVTQNAPIINVLNGQIHAVHTNDIVLNSYPNPELVFKSGTDNYFGNINANLIQINGTPMSTFNSTYSYWGSAIAIGGNGVDSQFMQFMDLAPGAQPWSLFTSGTSTSAMWGAGGIGLNQGTVNMWGVDNNGVSHTKTAIGITKQTVTPPIIGAGNCQLYAGPGTNAGTCRLFVMCGTSGTASVLLDNIGAGC